METEYRGFKTQGKYRQNRGTLQIYRSWLQPPGRTGKTVAAPGPKTEDCSRHSSGKRESLANRAKSHCSKPEKRREEEHRAAQKWVQEPKGLTRCWKTKSVENLKTVKRGGFGRNKANEPGSDPSQNRNQRVKTTAHRSSKNLFFIEN
jgi:hypothetical protein